VIPRLHEAPIVSRPLNLREIVSIVPCIMRRGSLYSFFMLLRHFKDPSTLARTAADHAAAAVRKAVADRGRCRIVLATGTSQFAFLDALTATVGLEWNKVEAFHLDEYVGMPITHPASFRKILLERVINKVGISKYWFIHGDASDISGMLGEVGHQLTSAPVDLAFVGIGENGHIAFNDPPADFETEKPYIVVELDEACRRQQVGEGWFTDISDVPRQAISMSVRQVMKARQIIAVVPDRRKARAVRSCFEGEISPLAPASILLRHTNATVYLDEDSAALLSVGLRSALVRDSQVVVRS
jgi:glucosamine-6-phosphate deaminase